MSVVEGAGPFTCTNASHKGKPFTTTKLEEFKKHEKEAGHKPYGRQPCKICGKNISFKDQEAADVSTLVCDTCKAGMK